MNRSATFLALSPNAVLCQPVRAVQRTPPRRTALACAVVAMAAMLHQPPAQAETRNWNCTVGKFETAGCWLPNGVPGAGDDVAVIGRAASATGPGAEVRFGASSGTRSLRELAIQQPAGTPTSARFIQDGGALTTSSVRLTGALGGEYVQYGGTHDTSFIRVEGASNAARYQLSGGALDVSSYLLLGGGSAINPSTFAHDGGSASIADVRIGNGGKGAYRLSDTALLAAPLLNAQVLTVGQDDEALFSQAGARSGVTATTLVVGSRGAGRYAMTTGTLTAGSATVGASAQGALVLDGGRQVFTSLLLGEQASGSGLWQVDSGTAELGRLIVGSGGHGEVLQSGGTVLVSAAFSVDTGSLYLLSGNAALQNAIAISNRGSFEHKGGIFSGTLSNDGIYVAAHPTKGQSLSGGRLVNRGQAFLLSSVSFNDGLRNEAAMSVLPTGLTLTLHGAGFDNADRFAINGGTLQGSGPMRSSGSFSGHGRIAGTGGAFTNSGSLRQEGGTLVLANTVGAVNSGRWILLAQNDLQLDGSALVFDNQGQLELNDGRISGTGRLVNGTAGIVSGSGNIGARFTNQGTLALVAGERLAVTGSFANEGLIDLSGSSALLTGATLSNTGLVAGRGRIANAISNQAAGRIQAADGVLVLAGPVSNSGLLVAGVGGTLLVQGTLTQAGRLQLEGGTVDLSGRDLVNQGVIGGWGALRGKVIQNQGQMQFSAGSAQIHGTVDQQAGGKIIVSGGGVSNFHGTVRARGGSELRVAQGSAAVFFASVSQEAGAAFTGSGTFYFEGGLSIGNSPGLGGAEGDVVFGHDNLYRAEIGGLASGSGFDHFVAGGQLTFGGGLQLSFLDGFEGRAGQRFDLFDWAAASGRFSAVDFAAAPLADGLRWDTSRLYVDGTVSITAVPEPASAALMALGLAALLAGRRTQPCRLRRQATASAA